MPSNFWLASSFDFAGKIAKGRSHIEIMWLQECYDYEVQLWLPLIQPHCKFKQFLKWRPPVIEAWNYIYFIPSYCILSQNTDWLHFIFQGDIGWDDGVFLKKNNNKKVSLKLPEN